MNLKCLIIDDDAMSSQMLDEMCKRVTNLTVERICQTATEAFNFLKQETIDLIFLDIELPDMSGLEFLKQTSQLPQVIITSSKESYAFEAFNFQVIDYLQKPIQYPRFIKGIERALLLAKQKVSSTNEEIYIRTDGKLIRLLLNEIAYIESLGDYVIFHTIRKEKHIAHSTMKNIEEKINGQRFVRVHRSFIINLSKIVDIQDTNLVVFDRVIPVSRAHKNNLFSLIQTI